MHSGANAFGAAGPMQIGIDGAAGNQWGGAPVHPASEKVNGVATDANGDGTASVYDPADAIAGAAKYLLEHGVLDNVDQAIFAYNHLQSYVQAVLYWANLYASGGYTVSSATLDSTPQCLPGVTLTSDTAVATAITYAEHQLGKPYLWGGTGPDAFDCSGLVMMAYRAAGIDIPRTSQQQWAVGSADQREPGAARGPGVLRGFGRHADIAWPRRARDRRRPDDRGVRDRVPDQDRALRRSQSCRLHPSLGHWSRNRYVEPLKDPAGKQRHHAELGCNPPVTAERHRNVSRSLRYGMHGSGGDVTPGSRGGIISSDRLTEF